MITSAELLMFLFLLVAYVEAQDTTVAPTTASANTTTSATTSSPSSCFDGSNRLVIPSSNTCVPTVSGTCASCAVPAFNPFTNTISPCVADVASGAEDCQQTGWMYEVNRAGEWVNNSNPCGYGLSFVGDNQSKWPATVSGVNAYQATPAPICWLLGGKGGYADVKQTLWHTTVDKFSNFVLTNSLRYNFSEPILFDCSTRISIHYGAGINSTPKRRFGFTKDGSDNTNTAWCNMIVPMWNIIIRVESGVVVGIDWDHDCSTCANDHCVDDFCAVNMNECTQWGGKTDCSMKIYVAWSGTDADGFYFTSEQSSLSRFRQWSISGAYNSATNILPSALPQVDTSGNSQAAPNPNNIGR